MKTGFLEEAPQTKSLTRVITAYCFLLVGFLIIHGTLTKTTIDFTLIVTLISAGAGIKLAQKPMETASQNKNSETPNQPIT